MTDAPGPLVVDTSALYARLDESDGNHERAVAVFEQVRDGDLPYGPLYVTGYVLAELHALAMRKIGVATAADSVRRLRRSPLFVVSYPAKATFDDACNRLTRYDDQRITLVDHVTATLARERGADAVFTFDDDFRTLGLTLAPKDLSV